MELKTVFSILVTIFSFGQIFLGMPSQIIKNYQEKQGGQSLLLSLTAIGFLGSQTGYYIVTGSYIAVIPFVLGIIMWSVLVYQYLFYKREKHKL